MTALARPISLMPWQLEEKMAGLEHYTDPDEAVKFWSRTALTRPRFVYFIGEAGDEESPIKVGEAFDPYKRMGTLQIGNWRKLELRAIILADEGKEKRLHIAWAQCRMRGEWFGGGDHLVLLEQALNVQRVQVERYEEGERDFYRLARIGDWIKRIDRGTWS